MARPNRAPLALPHPRMSSGRSSSSSNMTSETQAGQIIGWPTHTQLRARTSTPHALSRSLWRSCLITMCRTRRIPGTSKRRASPRRVGESRPLAVLSRSALQLGREGAPVRSALDLGSATSARESWSRSCGLHRCGKWTRGIHLSHGQRHGLTHRSPSPPPCRGRLRSTRLGQRGWTRRACTRRPARRSSCRSGRRREAASGYRRVGWTPHQVVRYG